MANLGGYIFRASGEKASPSFRKVVSGKDYSADYFEILFFVFSLTTNWQSSGPFALRHANARCASAQIVVFVARKTDRVADVVGAFRVEVGHETAVPGSTRKAAQ